MIATLMPPGITTSTAPVGTNGSITGTVTNSVGGGAIAGGTVQLIQGGAVLTTATPDGSGVYTFSGLTPATYTVTNQPPLAYSIADAGTFSVVVSSGGTATQDLSVQAAHASDNFQSYANTAAMKSGFWTGGGKTTGYSNTTDITLDPTGGPSGDKAMRYDWPDRSAQPCSGSEYTVACEAKIFPFTVTTSEHLWIRVLCKESAHFRHGNPTCVESYKFLTVIWELSPNPFGRYGSYLVGSFSSAKTDLNLDMPGGYYGSVLALSSDYGGSYTAWVIHIANPGTASSLFELYKDGVLFTSMTAPFLSGQDLTGYQVTLDMGSNINNGPPQVQSRWFREVGWYKTRPNMLVGVAV